MKQKLLVALLLIAAVGAIAYFVFVPDFSATNRSGRPEWSSDSMEPVPQGFMYVLFPRPDTMTYEDTSLTSAGSPLRRALLNMWDERDDDPIHLNGPDGTVRYVSLAGVTARPASSEDAQHQLDALVHDVGERFRPAVRDLRLTIDARSHPARFVLTVRQRIVRVFEYEVVDDRIVPRAWYMR